MLATRCRALHAFSRSRSPVPSGDNSGFLPILQSTTEISEKRATRLPTNTEHYRITTATIQLPYGTPWTRLAPRLSVENLNTDQDVGDHFSPPSHNSPSLLDSDEFTSDSSPVSSRFTFSPATWTPQEISQQNSQQNSPLPSFTIPTSLVDNTNMSDVMNCSFTGKPEDQDPQDFMNQLERIILMKTGLTEPEKVRFLELSMKAKSPAAAWFATLVDGNKKSFAAARVAFELKWPVKAITEKTTAEKQALLDETILKVGDLGRRVAASVGAEEELSHIVWADKVERLAGDIPDTNNLLVVSTRKKLPKPIVKLIGLKAMTWKELADAVRSITLEELMEKVEEERDLIRYALASRVTAPNTPSKALGSAFQNINIATQPRTFPTNQYQQTETNPRAPYNADRPAHERLSDVLTKALPIHPRNSEGIAQYNAQVLLWQTTHGQNGKGPNESRPYPLTPGTVPVASGECWKCGQRTHHPGPCVAPPVPALETKWRSIAQTIRKRAETAAQPSTSVNLVADESDEIHTYDTDELAHLQRLVNLGKGEGSSM